MRLLYACLERIVPGTAAATHVREICEGLTRRGVSVELLAEEGGRRGGGLADQLRRYGRVLGAACLALPRSDVVYLRSHFAGYPLALLARLLGRPVIHEINGAYDDAFVTHPGFRRVRGLLSAMQRAQYRRARALVAVTPNLAAWGAREAGHGRVHVVTNAADTARFRPDGPRAERARPYALFFGGLVRWHGVDTMLAAAALPDWPGGLDLVIAGPIVDRSLAPLIEAAPPRVAWIGPQPQEALPALIRGAAACLVPISDPSGRSSHGVMPLKLFEALACGTPVVATDLAGQADLVRAGGCGLVVRPDDPEALARAVADLASDPEGARRMGEAGARLVAAEHSWDTRAEETYRILEEIMRRA
jgi:glycosyltransferase involved in cell wall biosynthesis